MSADPDLVELARFATLAANGHNTQPWKFHLDPATVSIFPDFARRTQVVDPDDHHLYVSLGCAAENLSIAAHSTGRSTDLIFESGPQTRIDIALANGTVRDEALHQAIPLRQSTRSDYDGQPISASDITLLKAAARQEGVSVLIFTEASDREAILDLVVEANSAQMDDPAFVAELRDWIRMSPKQALETQDGLFAACTGNPIAPAWIASPLFDMFFQKDSENDKYRTQIRSSSGIAVFVGDAEDPEHWVKVGRSFQRFALQSTALGIRNAHINQPIEVAKVRPEFARWLGMPDARPDLVVRFGRAPALPMSLRRPIAEIMI
ncbi:Acg family FMN-binding oxidoreductase [Thalassovita taeanensis]|uniref:Tat pathway signal protein n=1 Tax=Thalassovita taeanensis TaxID=657014 RepID=A0A1H9EJZ8_9RHOB|nr:Tat pathway signal protein [Thalassovita taeanensis]SEQ26044.1 hypothetical protein SAMN04488092_10581 [Thalassovita taeanensis]